MKLSKPDVKTVKKVAKDLMDILKRDKLVLDWKKSQTTRAGVRLAIQILLDQLPRVYTPELYEHKCDMVYQHVYDSYWGQDKSLYSVN